MFGLEHEHSAWFGRDQSAKSPTQAEKNKTSLYSRSYLNSIKSQLQRCLCRLEVPA